MTLPLYRSHTNTGAAVSTSRVVSKPAGATENDIIKVGIYLEEDQVITVPSGWTLKASEVVSAAPDFHFSAHVYWKRLGPSEPATWTWSWPVASFVEATAVAFSGATLTGSPWDAFTSDADPAHVNTTPALSLVTTGPDRLLTWDHFDYIGGAKTQPTDFTERFDGGVPSTQMIADKDQAVEGSTGSLTSSYTGVAGPVAAFLGALLPNVVIHRSGVPRKRKRRLQ